MPLSIKTIKCPFCKTIMFAHATSCVECCAVKSNSLYNLWGTFVFGIGVLLLFPCVFYFLFQVSVVLTSEVADFSSLLAISVSILFLLIILIVCKRVPFLKGKWTRYT